MDVTNFIIVPWLPSAHRNIRDTCMLEDGTCHAGKVLG